MFFVVENIGLLFTSTIEEEQQKKKQNKNKLTKPNYKVYQVFKRSGKMVQNQFSMVNQQNLDEKKNQKKEKRKNEMK